MLDFIELGALIECPPKLSPCTQTVSDSRLDTKYWIEQYVGNHAHGNPWFVFTQTDSEEDYGDGPDRIIISIPYHANASAYANEDDCNDFCDYPEAWEDWLSYSREQRREYIRQFRKNKETKQLPHQPMYNMIFEQQIAAIKAAETVSCIPRCKVGTAPATICDTEQENETMIANTSEDTARKYLRDRANSLNYAKDDAEDIHFNLRDPEPPKDFEEALERFNAGKMTIRPKDQRKSYHSWYDHFTWRDPAKPADHVGKEKAVEKRRHDYQHLNDAIMVKAPADAVKDLHTFESKTFH